MSPPEIMPANGVTNVSAEAVAVRRRATTKTALTPGLNCITPLS
jgi:hypothetical protein